MPVAENLKLVRKRMELAAARFGRTLDDITLMAVTKTFGPDVIREAYEQGIRNFGENKVQEFAEKSKDLQDLSHAVWHLVGALQSNKAAKAAELFHAIDSLDSLKLAQKLNDAALKQKRRIPVLLEINIAGEASKSGLAPDSKELQQLLESAASLTGLDFHGLMTIPPLAEDPEAARPHFRRLRQLRDDIESRHWKNIRMDVLSMRMSHDFEIAIEEGSTCVRLGTAIFGERTASAPGKRKS
jgi:pyridoxal phosphate enzyme (YggS family)